MSNSTPPLSLQETIDTSPQAKHGIANRDIPSEGRHQGNVADKQRDNDRAARNMHEQFKQAKIEKGDAVSSGKGAAEAADT